MSKLDDAIALKYAALTVAQKRGEPLIRYRLLYFASVEFDIGLRTPFEFEPIIISEYDKYIKYKLIQKTILPYGISIWHTAPNGNTAKVFNIEWDEQGSIKIIYFKRGDWEESMLGLPTRLGL